MNTSNRLGMTLLETVTVIVICLVILALLLPAMRIARVAGPRTQCLNNQRNVAIAVLNYSATNNGRLPAQACYPDRMNSDGNTTEVFEGRSWAVDLMPYVDRQDIHDRWDMTKPWNSAPDAPGDISNSELFSEYIEAFTCPQDSSAFVVEGGLSYALNCGIGDRKWVASVGPRPEGRLESGHHFMVEPFDWNGNGLLPPEDLEDAAITRDFGVFWPQFGSPADSDKDDLRFQSHMVGKIYDGSGNTIMTGENVNSGMRPGAKKPSWADPHIGSSGLLLPVNAKRIGKATMASDGSLADIVITSPRNPGINQALNANEGTAPFPNSNHPGIGVFTFCDGSARTLSEKIDMTVYARLVTPCGTRERDIQEFVPEKPLTASEY